MSAKNTSVFGIYPDESEVVEAVEQLKRAGFRATDLSIMLSENLGSKDIGHEKHTKAPEGALAGGMAGAVIGGSLGWLINLGMIAIPFADVSALIAAVPVVAILAGVGACGTMGAALGALLGSCWPEYETKRYKGRIRSGGVLLSVHCDNAHWRGRAKSVLRQTAAEGIASTFESEADFGTSEKPEPRALVTRPYARKTLLMPPHQSPVVDTPPPDEPLTDVSDRKETVGNGRR